MRERASDPSSVVVTPKRGEFGQDLRYDIGSQAGSSQSEVAAILQEDMSIMCSAVNR